MWTLSLLSMASELNCPPASCNSEVTQTSVRSADLTGGGVGVGDGVGVGEVSVDEVSDDGVVADEVSDDEVSDGVVADEVSDDEVSDDGVVADEVSDDEDGDDVTQLASATTTIPSVVAMMANFFICNSPSVDIRRREPDVYGTLLSMLALWRSKRKANAACFHRPEVSILRLPDVPSDRCVLALILPEAGSGFALTAGFGQR